MIHTPEIQMRMFVPRRALQDLLLLALFLLQYVCTSPVPDGTETSQESVVLADDTESVANVYVVEYLTEPTETNLKSYAASYFYIFQGFPLDGMGALFELRIEQADVSQPMGLLMIALRLINNSIPGNNAEDRERRLKLHSLYAVQLFYGLGFLRNGECLDSEGDLQQVIDYLREHDAYCPGVSANPFVLSLLLAFAASCSIELFKQLNTAVIAQRCSEMYPSAMRNYPMLLDAFEDLSLVSVEAALQIYAPPNHAAFFAHEMGMKTVSSEVLLMILNLHDWELGTEQVKALVVARGKERLLGEIRNDCRAWQITRLMPSRDESDVSEDNTQDLFFDFDWEPFQYCATFRKAIAENALDPIQLKTAFLRYIVAIERYFHNALVMLRRTLDRISEYSGLDDADILENTEHRESLEPYIGRVREAVAIRMELTGIFQPKHFRNSPCVSILFLSPLSHRVRMLMEQKDAPLYLHLLKETNHKLQDIYVLRGELSKETLLNPGQLNASASEPKTNNPILEAHRLSAIWALCIHGTGLEKSRFTADLMFLLVEGLEAPVDCSSAPGKAYEGLLSRLRDSVLDHVQRKILTEDVEYVNSILSEHPIASELMNALVSPVSVGHFEQAVERLIFMCNMCMEHEEDFDKAFSHRNKKRITELNNHIEAITADIRRIVYDFTILELIDRIFPRLQDFPDTLHIIARVKGLFSQAHIEDLIVLVKQQLELSGPNLAIDFVTSSHGQKILSNVGVLLFMGWDQVPAIMVRSMALATSSMPAWQVSDVLAVFKKCDGIIHNFDSWVALIPDEVWGNLDVASVVGIEASFFAMFKVPQEELNVYLRIPCLAAIWLLANVKAISIEEVCLFVTKWMVRWELNFVQWRVYLKRLSGDQSKAYLPCTTYYIMHIYEANARSFMITALEVLKEDATAKGLIAQLKRQPASLCRLSYLDKYSKEIAISPRSNLFTNKIWLGSVTSAQDRQDHVDFVAKFYASCEAFRSKEGVNIEILNALVTQSIQSTFPKFGKKSALSKEAVDKAQSTITNNIEGFLRKYEKCPLQKKLWLTRLKLCAAVDADGIVSDPAMMGWIKERLHATHDDYKVLPANDLAFMELLSGLEPLQFMTA